MEKFMDNKQIKNTMALLLDEITVLDTYNLELIDDVIYNNINLLKGILDKDDAFKQKLISSILKNFKKAREQALTMSYKDKAYELNAHLQISLYTLIKKLIKYMDCADDEINQLIESQDDWLISTGFEILNSNDVPPKNDLIQITLEILRDNVDYAPPCGSLAKWLDKDPSIFDDIIWRFDNENIHFKKGILYAFFLAKKLTIEAETLVLRVLQDSSNKIRSSAVLPAGKCFYLRNEAIALLLKEIEDDEWHNQANAATSLSFLEVTDDAIIYKIADLLGNNRGDMDWSTEEAVIEALGKIGKPAKIILPKILKLLYFQLNGEKYENRILEICEAISRIDNGSELVISALIEVVDKCCTVAVTSALRALSKFGEKSKAVLPYLDKYVFDDEYLEGDYMVDDAVEVDFLKSLYKIAGADNLYVKTYINNQKSSSFQDVREFVNSFEKSINLSG